MCLNHQHSKNNNNTDNNSANFFLSLSEGLFPDVFKYAIVTPLHKKHSLPKDELSSYRPISNLNFISKILEP